MEHQGNRCGIKRQCCPHKSWSSSSCTLLAMAENKTWLRRRVESALRNGFMKAYETVKVDPDNFRVQLRAGYGLPISTYDGVFSLPVEQLDNVALDIIRASQKLAAV